MYQYPEWLPGLALILNLVSSGALALRRPNLKIEVSLFQQVHFTCVNRRPPERTNYKFAIRSLVRHGCHAFRWAPDDRNACPGSPWQASELCCLFK